MIVPTREKGPRRSRTSSENEMQTKARTKGFRDEKEDLTTRLSVLKKQLSALKRKRAWQDLELQVQAHEEARRMTKAKEHNMCLRQALGQQLEFASAIGKAFRHCPLLNLSRTCAKSSIKLTAAQPQRAKQMHAAVDAIYSQISMNAAATPAGTTISVSKTGDFQLSLDEVFTMEYTQLSALTLALFTCNDKTVGPLHLSVLQEEQDNLLYLRKTNTIFSRHGGYKLSTNLLFKRYQEDGVDFLVWCSVAEDEEFPIPSNCLPFHERGQLMFSNIRDNTNKFKARIHGYNSTRPPILQALPKKSPREIRESYVEGITQVLREFEATVRQYES